MFSKETNQPRIENVIVPSGDAALVTTGTFTLTGNAVPLANGQVGVVSWDFQSSDEPLGHFVPGANADVAKVKAIKIVQGTPNSANVTNANVFEVGDPPYVITDTISGDLIRRVTTQVYVVPKYSTHTATDFVAPDDETVYKIYARQLSVDDDRKWNNDNNNFYATYTTPNYTVLGTTSPTDHLLRHLLYEFNLQNSKLVGNGNKDVVALAIDESGGAGTVIGGIQCGDTVDFMTDGTTTWGLTIDAPALKALKEACDDAGIAEATATIEVIDLSIAGDADVVDAFIVMGLSRTLAAYDDEIYMLYPTVEVNVTEALSPNMFLLGAKQGSGLGRQVHLANSQRAQLDRHTHQVHPMNDSFSEGYNYLDPSKNYTVTVIEFDDFEETLNHRVVTPKLVRIYMESASVVCDDTVANLPAEGSQTATSDTTTLASLNAVLGAWLITAAAKYGFDYEGSASSSAVFV